MSDLQVTITHNTEFMSQRGWIAKALMDKDSVLGFFVQFEYAFGVFANPKGRNDLSKFEGLHISIPQMAASFKDAGYTKMSARKIEENLKVLVEIGAISKAKVTPHPRSPIIYVINEDSPHANQVLCERLAAKARDKSTYKDQAKNSAAKKQREATKVVTPYEEVAAKLSESLPKALSYVRTHLEQGGTVYEAYKAIKDIKNSKQKLSQGTFDTGIKKAKTGQVPLTREEETMLIPLRDELLQIELAERKETQKLKTVQYQEFAAEQRKLEQDRIAATPKTEIKVLTDEEIQASMADLLASVDL